MHYSNMYLLSKCTAHTCCIHLAKLCLPQWINLYEAWHTVLTLLLRCMSPTLFNKSSWSINCANYGTSVTLVSCEQACLLWSWNHKTTAMLRLMPCGFKTTPTSYCNCTCKYNSVHSCVISLLGISRWLGCMACVLTNFLRQPMVAIHGIILQPIKCSSDHNYYDCTSIEMIDACRCKNNHIVMIDLNWNVNLPVTVRFEHMILVTKTCTYMYRCTCICKI